MGNVYIKTWVETGDIDIGVVLACTLRSAISLTPYLEEPAVRTATAEIRDFRCSLIIVR